MSTSTFSTAKPWLFLYSLLKQLLASFLFLFFLCLVGEGESSLTHLLVGRMSMHFCILHCLFFVGFSFLLFLFCSTILLYFFFCFCFTIEGESERKVCSICNGMASNFETTGTTPTRSVLAISMISGDYLRSRSMLCLLRRLP
jgi:hypothetical protein